MRPTDASTEPGADCVVQPGGGVGRETAKRPSERREYERQDEQPDGGAGDTAEGGRSQRRDQRYCERDLTADGERGNSRLDRELPVIPRPAASTAIVAAGAHDRPQGRYVIGARHVISIRRRSRESIGGSYVPWTDELVACASRCGRGYGLRAAGYG